MYPLEGEVCDGVATQHSGMNWVQHQPSESTVKLRDFKTSSWSHVYNWAIPGALLLQIVAWSEPPAVQLDSWARRGLVWQSAHWWTTNPGSRDLQVCSLECQLAAGNADWSVPEYWRVCRFVPSLLPVISISIEEKLATRSQILTFVSGGWFASWLLAGKKLRICLSDMIILLRLLQHCSYINFGIHAVLTNAFSSRLMKDSITSVLTVTSAVWDWTNFAKRSKKQRVWWQDARLMNKPDIHILIASGPLFVCLYLATAQALLVRIQHLLQWQMQLPFAASSLWSRLSRYLSRGRGDLPHLCQNGPELLPASFQPCKFEKLHVSNW